MKISDDFKMVIVLDDSLPLGLMTNTAAVLSLTLGNKIKGLIGADLTDKSEHKHTSLTTAPLPILKCATDQLRKVYDQAYEMGDELLLVDITDAAQTTKNYADYEVKLKDATTEELKFLGVAIAGSQKLVNKLTGSLGLVR